MRINNLINALCKIRKHMMSDLHLYIVSYRDRAIDYHFHTQQSELVLFAYDESDAEEIFRQYVDDAGSITIEKIAMFDVRRGALFEI